MSGEEEPPQQRAGAGPAVLWLLLALQLGLALAAHSGRVYLDDEVGTWRAVQDSLRVIATRFDEWQTQPAYFLLAKLAAWPLGATELALRLPALVSGLGLTAATFLLVRRLVDAPAATCAAGLVALHPFLVFYSQMARGYSLSMALVVLSLWSVHVLARGEGRAWVVVLCVLARAGSVYAHLGACATVVAELLLALHAARGLAPPARRRALRRALGAVLGGGLLALALYAPLLPGMLAFRERWTGAGVEGGGFDLGWAPLVARAYGGGTALGTVLLGALVLAGLARCLRSPERSGAGLSLLAGVAAVVGFYAALDTAHYPWAFARFLTPALPLLLALAGIGLAGALRGPLLQGRSAGAPLCLVGLVALLAFRDTLRVATDPKDLHWPTALAEARAGGPRTLLLAPLRFHAFEPYQALAGGPELPVLRLDQAAGVIARGGAAGLAQRPLRVLLDVVPAEGLEAHFELREEGSTTILDRPASPGPEGERGLLVALQALAQAQRAFLEPRERQPAGGPWVFWRLDARHEHAWAATPSLAAALALEAATQGALGDPAGAQASLQSARAVQAAAPVPGSLGSRWGDPAVARP